MIEWTMRDGTKIKLKDMKTSHIENCIKMLEQQIKKMYDIDIMEFAVPYFEDEGGFQIDTSDLDIAIERKQNWIKAFEKELESRVIDE